MYSASYLSGIETRKTKGCGRAVIARAIYEDQRTHHQNILPPKRTPEFLPRSEILLYRIGTNKPAILLTGMSRVYISELERGLREPGLGTILKLARCFGVQASEVIAAVEQELTKKARRRA